MTRSIGKANRGQSPLTTPFPFMSEEKGGKVGTPSNGPAAVTCVRKVMIISLKMGKRKLKCMFTEMLTVIIPRMSLWKWRETKQQASRARSGRQISCCFVSLHFLCNILATRQGDQGTRKVRKRISRALSKVPATGFTHPPSSVGVACSGSIGLSMPRLH